MEDLGLQGALEWLVSNFTHKTNLPVHFHCKTEPHIFDSQTNLTIYRVAQECLSNIARYAQATQVTFTLEVHKDQIELSVNDNGIGFAYQEIDTRLHHGLLGMRERLNAVNGTLKVTSSEGAGTLIEASIPIATA